MSPPEPGRLRGRDDEPPFGEPWHAETLAMADLLVRSGTISAAAWAEALGAEIAAASGGRDDAETYFSAALAALTRLLAARGAVGTAELAARERAWAQAYHDTPHGRPVTLG